METPLGTQESLFPLYDALSDKNKERIDEAYLKVESSISREEFIQSLKDSEKEPVVLSPEETAQMMKFYRKFMTQMRPNMQVVTPRTEKQIKKAKSARKQQKQARRQQRGK